MSQVFNSGAIRDLESSQATLYSLCFFINPVTTLGKFILFYFFPKLKESWEFYIDGLATGLQLLLSLLAWVLSNRTTEEVRLVQKLRDISEEIAHKLKCGVFPQKYNYWDYSGWGYILTEDNYNVLHKMMEIHKKDLNTKEHDEQKVKKLRGLKNKEFLEGKEKLKEEIYNLASILELVHFIEQRLSFTIIDLIFAESMTANPSQATSQPVSQATSQPVFQATSQPPSRAAPQVIGRSVAQQQYSVQPMNHNFWQPKYQMQPIPQETVETVPDKHAIPEKMAYYMRQARLRHVKKNFQSEDD